MLIAVGIGVAIMAFGIWAVRLLATPPPPEPDPDAVEKVAMNFVCTVCGMQLTVNLAQSGEVAAPKHCREPMVAI